MFKRAVLAIGAMSLILTTALAVLTAGPASAYGKANWQVTFAGTATVPGAGFGFGFWGWCEFAGGVTSGNDGDCQFAQYVHLASGSGFTCHESLDLTAWTAAGGTFVITGTSTVSPTNLTNPCNSIFPGSSSFTGVDTGIPAMPGHFDIGLAGIPGGAPPGAVGEFNVTVVQVS
jgi:hypothetical protein